MLISGVIRILRKLVYLIFEPPPPPRYKAQQLADSPSPNLEIYTDMDP